MVLDPFGEVYIQTGEWYWTEGRKGVEYVGNGTETSETREDEESQTRGNFSELWFLRNRRI